MNGINENGLLVNLVQACLGSITPNFKSITMIMTSDNCVRCIFVLRSPSKEDQEEIDEIVFEFEALVSNYIAVDVEVRIGQTIPEEGRHVFVAK